MTNEELIRKATAVIRERENEDYLIGDVGCALETDKGNVYLGVCIDTMSSMGFCAEHNAIGSMVTAGESRIKKIVAVSKSPRRPEGAYILAPCGRCREFMYRINKDNLDAEVVLSETQTVPLRELLPHADSWEKVH